MIFDVFISHSSKDKTMADAVCARLEQAGIRCWIAPRDIAPGLTWSGEIMKAIEGCRVMVLVFSANANESVQIIREVEAAVHRGKPILPFRIENIEPCDSMAFFMSSVHWLDAISEPHERYLDQLVKAVSGLLGNADLSDAPTIKGKVFPQPVKKEERVMREESIATPKPPFDWKPVLYAVPGGVALLVVLVYFLWPHAPDIPSIGGGVHMIDPKFSDLSDSKVKPISSGGPVDSATAGDWYLKTTMFNYDGLVKLTYGVSGTYTMETVLSDAGTYESGAGQFVTKSNGSGFVRKGTYEYDGAHSIKCTGPLGSAVYYIDSSQPAVDPANPVMLGPWVATINPPNSPPWKMTETNEINGTYTFKIDILDAGSFTSADGKLTMHSQITGATANGTYRKLDNGSMEFTGPLGTATWTRTEP